MGEPGQRSAATQKRVRTSASALDLAAAELRAGAIVAVPTETVYGLAVLPNATALARLVAAKRRSADKGIALLVNSIEQVKRLAVMPPLAQLLAARFWPGALTLVLPQLPDAPLPELLTGGRLTIGVRLPDHPVPRALASRLGPIAVSSANVSGQPDAISATHVLASLSDEVALVIDDGPVRGGVPSTVVACQPDGSLQILRAGAITEAEVRATVSGD